LTSREVTGLKREVSRMSYYFSKMIDGPFDAAVGKVKAKLKKVIGSL
jgi:hypothetical protein